MKKYKKFIKTKHWRRIWKWKSNFPTEIRIKERYINEWIKIINRVAQCALPEFHQYKLTKQFLTYIYLTRLINILTVISKAKLDIVNFFSYF